MQPRQRCCSPMWLATRGFESKSPISVRSSPPRVILAKGPMVPCSMTTSTLTSPSNIKSKSLRGSEAPLFTSSFSRRARQTVKPVFTLKIPPTPFPPREWTVINPRVPGPSATSVLVSPPSGNPRANPRSRCRSILSGRRRRSKTLRVCWTANTLRLTGTYFSSASTNRMTSTAEPLATGHTRAGTMIVLFSSTWPRIAGASRLILSPSRIP
ncbi:hypothetical protein DFH07DRAFT_823838 [Mycena maculata]|uniref:Uncharacterized protein n=1 Tax=Mycena maculata TaxID=230809 RepID=A0AAD7J0X3_9AGAR|nr:hypothetical protein DFH07DRAFT_823838 [Mycena maculata]